MLSRAMPRMRLTNVSDPISFAWETNERVVAAGASSVTAGAGKAIGKACSDIRFLREAEFQPQMGHRCAPIRNKEVSSYQCSSVPHRWLILPQFCFQSRCGGFRVVATRDRCGDRDRFDARRQHFIDIRLGDARNRDGGNLDLLDNLPGVVGARDEVPRLGRAAEERADADVVGAVADGVARLIEVVRADAEDLFAPEELTNLRGG